MSFGRLLRRLRLDAGLTQEGLADSAGLSARSVSDLERGINLTARKDTARLLADALQLSGQDRAAFEAAASGRVPADGFAAATKTLPRDIASFTGRESELRRLEAAVPAADGGVAIYAIGGMAGVGKTAFAVHAAHLLAPKFPDGQVFLPLHAHTPGQRQVDPVDALASLLQTIGVAVQQVPAGLEARMGLWRDQLAGKRLVLLLDDAADSEQVRPLLPGSGRSLILITSRRHLTALEDAQTISLDALPPGEAATLLLRLAARPDLVLGDPAVPEITGLCGYLPLALGMLARHLHHHPAWTAADLAADLAQARDRLALMHAEDLTVAAAFDRSYQDLTDEQQRMFRRLGLHPGIDVDAYAAAALAGVGVTDARRILGGIYDHYLLAEPARGRYRPHDLIRVYARVLAAQDLPAERDAAVGRLLDYYLHTIRVADRYLGRATAAVPGVPALTGSSPTSGSVHVSAFPPASAASQPSVEPPAEAPELPTRQDALAWMEAERLNLLAAAGHAATCGLNDHAAAIPAVLHEFLRGQGHWGQAVTLHRAALGAARAAGSQTAEARALTDLGDIQYLTDDYPAATAALTSALELFRGLRDRRGEADALLSLGAVQQATGHYPQAAASQERALELYRAVGDRGGEADALIRLGAVQQATGRYAEAAASQERALELYRAVGDRRGEANALTDLGSVRFLTGQHHTAEASQQRALELYRDLGDRLGEADALTDLGSVQYLTGEWPAARASLARALELYRAIGDWSGEAEALNNIGELALAAGASAQARGHYQRALEIATRITAPREEARALEGIGRCHLQDGQPDRAQVPLRQALAVYQRIGSPDARRIQTLLTPGGR
ncbi:MAG TPA: tetratricopeptide repeat protein [Streptosporangiaceae bacterium]|nr:tetratricopeptide repeat protein [Streptosporangiaceae bacterium]